MNTRSALSPRKRKAGKRKAFNTSIDLTTFLTLQMLGFDIRELIEQLLSKVAGIKTCPCCGREVRPVITGRSVKI